MFVLGVTGGIGSGKSAATDIFSSLGIKIVDADVLSRVPVQKGEAGLFEIEKRYGSEILLATGELDRKKLREIIFEKEEEKDWLENLLHPLIADLIKEELEELREAIEKKDIKEVADALTDILYVTYGAGHAFGINLDKCFEEVQNSNMSKLGEDGKPIYNDKGKVMKGPNYFKPDLSKFLK